jgi:hypothetical protein
MWRRSSLTVRVWPRASAREQDQPVGAYKQDHGRGSPRAGAPRAAEECIRGALRRLNAARLTDWRSIFHLDDLDITPARLCRERRLDGRSGSTANATWAFTDAPLAL